MNNNGYPRLMSEQNRILRAMADRDDFTVDDLVRLCEASPSTVRTVLLRNRPFVEELGFTETGRPGGKWKRYRLRADALKSIEAAAPSGREDQQVPLDLIAAEEMLLSSTSIDVERPARSSLLRRAQRRIRHASGDPAANGPIAEAHEYVVRGLVTLVEAEGKGDATGLLRAEASRKKARRALAADDKLLEDFGERIDRSPLQDLVPVERRARASTAVAKEAVLADMVSVVTKIVDRSRAQVVQTVLYESPEAGRAVVPRPAGLGPRHIRRKAAERARTRKFGTVRIDSTPVPASSVAWDIHTGWLAESEQGVVRHG